MEIERNIRVFFARYGRFLLFIIGVLFLIITSIQTANTIVKEEVDNEKNLIGEEREIRSKENEKIESEKKVITKFIDYCKENQIEEAYQMLSDINKKEYETIEEFKEEFVKSKFLIKIISYKIYQENNYYVVKMQQDFLETGNQNTYVVMNLKVHEEILGDKIEILM